ncbi:MAG: S-adenosyl-l-methionine hydroxide adenosyltransferase family protein [Candidatus Hydrothermarchaeaceae archaeon]
MKKVITFITDFGESAYVGAMKGVIASICPDAKVIDVTHRIKKFDVRHAAYELHVVAPYFPKGSIHCVVVDPRVGTERRSLIVETEAHSFVGPDNGVFSFLQDIKGVYELEVDAASSTFHGRDVFAPAAARLACGEKPASLGKRAEGIKRIPLREVEVDGKRVTGEVIVTDYFGNVISNIRKEDLEKAGIGYGDKVLLRVRGLLQGVRMVESYGFAKKGELICLVGSAGYLEIATNQGDAMATFGVRGGEEVVMEG